MKIMGICAGRKGGNTEILMKEALSVCQEKGAEIVMINLHDYHIEACIGCNSCSKNLASGKVGCVLDSRDDVRAIMEVMLEVDGVIIGAPTYDLMPAGLYTKFANRFLTFEAANLRRLGLMEVKDRVCGILAVGGSTRAWQSIAQECIQATTFTQSLKVVDQYLATRVPLPGMVTLNQEMLDRVRLMGERIYEAASTPVAERRWLGDPDEGWCPVCHSHTMTLGEPQWDGKYWPVECSVCGAGGDLEKGADGRWKFVLAEDGMDRCRVNEEGRGKHFVEIRATKAYGMEHMDEIKANLAKYRAIQFPTIAPKAGQEK